MEDDDGTHMPPIDDDGALQQGMEGGAAAIHQGLEAGDAGIVEEADMEDSALQDMEAADAGLEEAMVDEDAALIQQEMEGDDAGLEELMDDDGALHDLEAVDAGLEEVMEDEDAALIEQDDLGQGMEVEDDAGLEQGFEDGDDGDAGLEDVMEDEHEDEDEDQGQGMEGEEDAAEAGLEQDPEDEDAPAVIDIDQFIEEMGGGVTLLPPNHVLPLSIPAYEASPAHLRHQWNEFKRSGPLESIVLLADRGEEDGYGDGPPDTVGPLFRDGDYRSIDWILPEWTLDLNRIREAFNARTHATIEALLFDGRRIQLDFLRKICVEVDEDGNPLRTVAMYWLDDQYRVFVSARIFGVDEEVVRQRFNEACGGRLVITAVRRCSHRLHGMDPFCERMQVQRPVFGWYGAEAELLEHMAFEDEALHSNWQRVENLGYDRPYGHGAHIAPLTRMMKSVLVSLAGAPNQPGHMLFCAMAPGFKEIVPEGSEQDSPSNPLFQSGIAFDERGLCWHIMWVTSDPGGVLPLYLVSFARAGH